jgi:hypothetical protein
MSVPCKHWKPAKTAGRGICGIKAYSNPAEELCMRACAKYEGPPRPDAKVLDDLMEQMMAGIHHPCGKRVEKPPTEG